MSTNGNGNGNGHGHSGAPALPVPTTIPELAALLAGKIDGFETRITKRIVALERRVGLVIDDQVTANTDRDRLEHRVDDLAEAMGAE